MATTSVIGGKTLRPCDSCVGHRARWYCAADDAFLCQSCDSSVHSANPLAHRHHRLQTSSTTVKSNKLAPTWHHGFKRKARTPRLSPKAKNSSRTALPTSSLVPEIETSAADEGSNEEEEQLLYRVPIFDPVLAEFYSPTLVDGCNNSEAKPSVQFSDSNTNSNSSNCLSGFLQSDTELAEFAADMERLLGRGFENNSFSMEELGLVDAKNEQVKEEFADNENDTIGDHDVKIYEEIDLSRETIEIDFDCRSGSDEGQATDEYEEARKMKIGLRLDYKAVSVEWSAHGCLSPYMNGERPQLGPDDCWLNYKGMWGAKEVQGVAGGEAGGVHIDEEREARVSRYREKRSTRLFFKKIRYQVRKLNAEKRPRMKGRFVKRASF